MSLQQSSRDEGVFKYEETKAQSVSQSADATEPKSHRPPGCHLTSFHIGDQQTTLLLSCWSVEPHQEPVSGVH